MTSISREERVALVRDAMISTLLLAGKDMTDEQVAQLAEAAIAALSPDERLIEALEPFARIGGDIYPATPDDQHIFMAGIRQDRTATAGDYRKAREIWRSTTKADQ